MAEVVGQNGADADLDWGALEAHVQNVEAEDAEAAKQKSFHEHRYIDSKEREQLISEHKEATRELGKLGYDRVPAIAEPKQPSAEEVEAAEQSLAEVTALAEQCRQKFDQAMAMMIEKAKLSVEPANRHQFLHHLNTDPEATRKVPEQYRQPFRVMLDNIIEAERELATAQARVDRLRGEVREIDANTAKARELIIEANEKYEQIQGLEGEFTLDQPALEGSTLDEAAEWAKTHTVVKKEGNPLMMADVQTEAEKEKSNRERFVDQAIGILRFRRNNSEDFTPDQKQFFSEFFNRYIAVDMRTRGRGHSFGENDPYYYGLGLREPRSYHNRGMAVEPAQAAGEKLGKILGRSNEYPSLHDWTPNEIMEHAYELNMLKALSEAIGSGHDDQLLPHGEAWLSDHGSIRPQLDTKGMVCRPGDPIVPTEWLNNPNFRDKLAEAKKQYDEIKAKAEAIGKKHIEAVTEKFRQELTANRQRLAQLEASLPSIMAKEKEYSDVVMGSDSLTNKEYDERSRLRNEIEALKTDRYQEEGKPLGIFKALSGYTAAAKEHNLSEIDRQMEELQRNIAEIENRPRERQRRKDQLRSEGVHSDQSRNTTREMSDIKYRIQQLEGVIQRREQSS